MSLTKVSYSMTKGAPINAVDFGAVGDGVTDDSAAIQAAITYCIANDKDLVVDGLCYLASTVNINRKTDDPLYDNFFTIYSQSGGGFIVKTSIPMFSSNVTLDPAIYPVNAPVSQLTRFQDLRLESSDALFTEGYVLNANKLFRTWFVGCSFRKIKLLNAAAAGQYIQSLYINNCNMRRWFGFFLNAQQGIFDFKFENNICEAGDGCLNLMDPVGAAITNNVIEGMANGNINEAIRFRGAQGLLISGNYFEGNTGTDIADISDGATGSKTVSIIGNFFDPGPRTTPCIAWGDTTVAIASGNYMKKATGTLHGLGAGSFVNITDLSEGLNANAPSYTYMRDLYNASSLGTNYGGVIRGTSVSGQGGKLIFGLLNADVPVEYVNIDSSGNWSPVADNVRSLGTASFKWSQLFAGTAVINTSDERHKQDIQDIDAAALRAWGKVNYCQFKFKDAVVEKGNKARWHIGLIAQRVKEAFESEGLDAFEYGLLCYDEWEEERIDHPAKIGRPAVYDTNGKLLREAKPDQEAWTEIKRTAGNIYGIRYEEALALECAYLRSKLS